MPTIFDNIVSPLLPALRNGIEAADRGDFSVGYLNLRGWRAIADAVERWPGGENHCCRLLIGMQRAPQDVLREAFGLAPPPGGMDNATAIALKKKLAQDFREQLAMGIPNNEDEAGLRHLAAQIKSKKVVVKLFLRHALHAKLYLLFRENEHVAPWFGYLGSSNLTLPGLSKQGELNIDVLDQDACQKLAAWFRARWQDNFCLDISQELVEIIETSWVQEPSPPPYHIYIKMAYELSREARAGLTEFRIPVDFGDTLFEFQKAAVKIAAHHLNKRGGVLIGDVVGLGKTLMATAVARIFEDDYGLETLIICPKNLKAMWEHYAHRYRLRAKIISMSRVQKRLPDLHRYRLVLIDESHNLRNPEGGRYKAIADYIRDSDSKVILLSATPYNKTYLDLSSQLALFLEPHEDIGIRPEHLLREMGEAKFLAMHQCPVRSLAAFEKSEYADDWRQLMRLYMVRRTRGFIQENYAKHDAQKDRKYLEFPDGKRSYFPVRIPRTVKFRVDDSNSGDQYAKLFSQKIVDTINDLALPRYGLANYISVSPRHPPTPAESTLIANLSRAGPYLKGFCRTGLFKRLESGGYAFMLSAKRHILRNFVFMHAISQGKNLPIGPQDATIMDAYAADGDADSKDVGPALVASLTTEADFQAAAAAVLETYETQSAKRFKWMRPALFDPQLAVDLRDDAHDLLAALNSCGPWRADGDAKLHALHALLARTHADEKVLVFTQFADTAKYLAAHLRELGIEKLEVVTGNNKNPTALAQRFSPISNGCRDRIAPADELRVLISTDVLSEGQNLQDCHAIVNFDLPWAIIRLIQRAGRVDRIGQDASTIYCYSFLPAEGVERIIRLRHRVLERLKENAEVVGGDEIFFADGADAPAPGPLVNLFNEKAGVLDDDGDAEVDLASYAYQIWKNAIERNPSLQKTIPGLPNVAYSARAHTPAPDRPSGALVYMRTAEGTDALAWVDEQGNSVTESQFSILKAAECPPATPALPRPENHFALVQQAATEILQTEKPVGGQLGKPGGPRFRAYERLKTFAIKMQTQNTLLQSADAPPAAELEKALDELYKLPLLRSAADTLTRQIKAGIDDASLANLVTTLYKDRRLCHPTAAADATAEAQIICSLGLVANV